MSAPTQKIKSLPQGDSLGNLKNEDKIRRSFDEKSGLWYFSIVDVVGYITNSSDARNYWKVLKNRLKTGNNREREVVTLCNQLKMRSKDGKFYLTDVADAETMLKIIQSVPGADIERFKGWFESFVSNIPPFTNDDISPRHEEEKSEEEAELMVDVYQTDTFIVIEAMTASVDPENISISVEENKITIRGNRPFPKVTPWGVENNPKNYFLQELFWLSFSRTIMLPASVQIDKIEKKEEYGRLIITLPKVTPWEG